MDTTTSLPDIVDPEIVEIADQVSDQLSKDLQYTKLNLPDYFPTIPDPKFSTTSGLGAATITIEGQTYGEEDRIQGYDVQATVTEYTQSCSYTKVLYHWIMKGNKEKAMEFREGVEAVMNSLHQRIDMEAAKVYYLGHGTTFQTGGDGKALFAYDHPSPDPTVTAQRNIFKTTETQMPLSPVSLETARTRINRLYGLREVQIKRSRKLKLYIPAELEPTAIRITQSEKRPGGDLNDLNIFRKFADISYEVIDWQPTAYDTYWVLAAEDRAAKQNNLVWGWKPNMESESELRKGVYWKLGSVYFKPVFKNYTWAWGCKGDSSAITS